MDEHNLYMLLAILGMGFLSMFIIFLDYRARRRNRRKG